MYYPLYFCYRDIIKEHGLPEYPKLICEKGCWMHPDFKEQWIDDNEVLPLIYTYWNDQNPELTKQLFPSIQDLETFWKKYKA